MSPWRSRHRLPMRRSNTCVALLPITCAIRSPQDVVWHFSGVRPLFDDGADEATEATRDYVITQDRGNWRKIDQHLWRQNNDLPKTGGRSFDLVDQTAKKKTRSGQPTRRCPAATPATQFEQLLAKATTDFPFVEPVT